MNNEFNYSYNQNGQMVLKTATCNILDGNEEFRITNLGDSVFGADLNITYRSPRKIDGVDSFVVATTTLKCNSFKNLRVENIDGQSFIVNEAEYAHANQMRFAVISEDIGNLIINAILKGNPKDDQENRTPSKDFKTSLLNRVVNEIAPAVLLMCAVSLSVAATYWMAFK